MTQLRNEFGSTFWVALWLKSFSSERKISAKKVEMNYTKSKHLSEHKGLKTFVNNEFKLCANVKNSRVRKF